MTDSVIRIDALAEHLRHVTTDKIQRAHQNLNRLEHITTQTWGTSLRQDDGSRATNAPSQPLANVMRHDWIYSRRWHLNQLLDALAGCIHDLDHLADELARLEPHQPPDDTTTDSKAHAEHKCNSGIGKKLEGWSQWHVTCTHIVTDNEIIDGMCHHCLAIMNNWRLEHDLDPITRDSLDRHYRHPYRTSNGQFTKNG